jgi:hypothetical protein
MALMAAILKKCSREKTRQKFRSEDWPRLEGTHF